MAQSGGTNGRELRGPVRTFKVGVNAAKKSLEEFKKSTESTADKTNSQDGPRVVRIPRCLASSGGSRDIKRDCSWASLHGLTLKNEDLSNVPFDNADLTDVDFSNSDLRGSTFRGANLSGDNLFGALVAVVDFTSTKLEGTTMPDGTIHE